MLSKGGTCVLLLPGWKFPVNWPLGKGAKLSVSAECWRGVDLYRQRRSFEVQRKHFGLPRSHCRFELEHCSQDFCRDLVGVFILLVNRWQRLLQTNVFKVSPLDPCSEKGSNRPESPKADKLHIRFIKSVLIRIIDDHAIYMHLNGC